MADKAISQLNAATSVTSVDLFVLEQSGEAKKLTGQILENWLVIFEFFNVSATIDFKAFGF